MRLNTISGAEGSRRTRKRVGRGIGRGLERRQGEVTKGKNHALEAEFFLVSKADSSHYSADCLSSGSPPKSEGRQERSLFPRWRRQMPT